LPFLPDTPYNDQARDGYVSIRMVEMLSQKGAVPHDGGTFFGLWAPNATAVFVTGTFNDWSPTAHPLDKQPERNHYFVNLSRKEFS